MVSRVSPLARVEVVAVGLALVLGTALTTAAVRRPVAEPPPAAPAPTTAAPAPTTPSPEPTAPSPVPSTTAPAPTTAAPAPTTPSPEPTAPSPVPSTPAPVPTSSSPVPMDVRAALEERLRMPPGTSTRLPDEENGLGPLDAAGVLALSGGFEQDRAAAAQGLERLGFHAALARGWTAEGRVYVLLVYRFATAEGAAGLVSGLATRLPGPALETHAVPDAVAYTGRSERYYEQHASFARGRYVYELTYLTPQEDPSSRRFERLLCRQAAHAARLDP